MIITSSARAEHPPRRHGEKTNQFPNRNFIYTVLVKIAVIYHDLIRRAERTARKMSISRTNLLAIAILKFLKHRHTRTITEQLNKIYAEESSRLAPALHSAQIRSLDGDRW